MHPMLDTMSWRMRKLGSREAHTGPHPKSLLNPNPASGLSGHLWAVARGIPPCPGTALAPPIRHTFCKTPNRIPSRCQKRGQKQL